MAFFFLDGVGVTLKVNILGMQEAILLQRLSIEGVVLE